MYDQAKTRVKSGETVLKKGKNKVKFIIKIDLHGKQT